MDGPRKKAPGVGAFGLAGVELGGRRIAVQARAGAVRGRQAGIRWRGDSVVSRGLAEIGARPCRALKPPYGTERAANRGARRGFPAGRNSRISIS